MRLRKSMAEIELRRDRLITDVICYAFELVIRELNALAKIPGTVERCIYSVGVRLNPRLQRNRCSGDSNLKF